MYSPALFISSSDNFKANSLEFPPGEDTSMSCNAFLLPVLPEAIKSAYVDSTSVIANKYPHSSTWMGEKNPTLRLPEKQMMLWNRNTRTRGVSLWSRLAKQQRSKRRCLSLKIGRN